MTSDQIEALMAARRASHKREAAMQIYMGSPSGFLGGISRSCRESLEEAMRIEQDAKDYAVLIGCDIGMVHSGSPSGLTIHDMEIVASGN